VVSLRAVAELASSTAMRRESTRLLPAVCGGLRLWLAWAARTAAGTGAVAPLAPPREYAAVVTSCVTQTRLLGGKPDGKDDGKTGGLGGNRKSGARTATLVSCEGDCTGGAGGDGGGGKSRVSRNAISQGGGRAF